MIGSINKKEDDKLINRRLQNTGAALQATQKFSAPIPQGGPLRRATTTTRSNFGPALPSDQGVKAPKTMGDVFRYNREMAAQKQTADIANENARTGITAFTAANQGKHFEASDANAQANTRLTGEHYSRSDDASDTRNAILDRRNRAQTAYENRNLNTIESVRGAQVESMSTQSQAIKTNLERGEAQANLASMTAENRMALAADPTNPVLQQRLQAFEGKTVTPTTEAELANMSQKDMDGFTKFVAANPSLNQSRDLGPLLKQYKQFKKELDPNYIAPKAALTASPDNQQAGETNEEYLNRLLGR